MRRAILLISLLGWLVSSAHAQTHIAFHDVKPADVKWTNGLWADRFETCRTATVPTMGRLMEGTDRSQFLENFRIAAGLKEGRHRGPPWNDGDYYKWLEAAIAVNAVTKDDAQERRIDEAIRILAK